MGKKHEEETQEFIQKVNQDIKEYLAWLHEKEKGGVVITDHGKGIELKKEEEKKK